jgi:hypothetical protein
LPIYWLVPGAFNGRFTSRVPIPYFNVNVALLARKLDEWAAMTDEALDHHEARRWHYPVSWTRTCCGRSTTR